MSRASQQFLLRQSESSGKKKKIALRDDTDSLVEPAPEKNAIKNYGPELDDIGDEQSDIDGMCVPRGLRQGPIIELCLCVNRFIYLIDNFFQNNDEPSNNAETSGISGPPKSSEPDFIPLKDTYVPFRTLLLLLYQVCPTFLADFLLSELEIL